MAIGLKLMLVAGGHDGAVPRAEGFPNYIKIVPLLSTPLLTPPIGVASLLQPGVARFVTPSTRSVIVGLVPPPVSLQSIPPPPRHDADGLHRQRSPLRHPLR
jgi:hypothetical protein